MPRKKCQKRTDLTLDEKVILQWRSGNRVADIIRKNKLTQGTFQRIIARDYQFPASLSYQNRSTAP